MKEWQVKSIYWGIALWFASYVAFSLATGNPNPYRIPPTVDGNGHVVR